jgi:hypothetical protein
MPTTLIRRGPWAYLLDDPDTVRQRTFRLDSLAALPELLHRHNTEGGR